MMIRNIEIAAAFDKLANLLSIQADNPFRIRAYRNAAMTIRNLPASLSSMVAAGEDLSKLPTIGQDLAGKIAEMVRTRRLGVLETAEQSVPGDLAKMLTLPGLGPKRVSVLHQQGGIQTLAQLKRAASSGQLRELPGFGVKSEQRILSGLERLAETAARWRLVDAEKFAYPLLDYLKRVPGVLNATIAGSFRRRRETVGDIDILVTGASSDAPSIIEAFASYDEVQTVVSKGITRSTVILHAGLQVDLRVIPKNSYGAALHYFTGSKSHNIAIRRMAVDRGLKVNEYGVFKGTKQQMQRLAGKTETQFYALFGMAYIAPELRENRGEIQAAQRNELPKLVELSDLRGDLHLHSNAADGSDSIEAMAHAAQALGYDFIAITDHSKNARIANGLTTESFLAQIDEIDRLNEKLKPFRILKSCEVDILEDGQLDLSNTLLARFDLCVCAVHDHRLMSSEQMTDRIIRAMDNQHFNILAHPTGRLIGVRDPIALNFERLLKAAAERGCFMEVNAAPERLDLNDLYCRLIRESCTKVAISSDAHSVTQMPQIRFGLDQARRGWLERDHVLNTRSWTALARLFKR